MLFYHILNVALGLVCSTSLLSFFNYYSPYFLSPLASFFVCLSFTLSFFLFIYFTNLTLLQYGFYTGCYLPGPVVEGVPDVLKLISNTLIHGYLAVGFSKYVRLIK